MANLFLDSLKSISTNTEVVMLLILGVFAAAHSGLAYLRPYGKLQQLRVLHSGHGQQLQLEAFACQPLLLDSCWVCYRETQICNWQCSCLIRQPQRWLSRLAGLCLTALHACRRGSHRPQSIPRHFCAG